MIFANLTKGQIIFLVIVGLILALAVFFIIYIPAKQRFKIKKFKLHFYKKINQIAFDEDYYLINDFLFTLGDSKENIDHILFGDKFIYVINDYYYDGSLSGNDDEDNLSLIGFKGQKYITDNPIKESQKAVRHVSMITGTPIDFLIGIVLVNDECDLNIKQTYKTHYIIQRRDLKALIKSIESRNVNKLKEAQLQRTVTYFDKINEKHK